ncbi:MAG: GIY-YIG nuclease family protein [Nanoarchaeota archaeon]
MEKKWIVYLVECLNGSFYTGVTNDVEKRMKAHSSGKGSKYVRASGFSRLVSTKNFSNKSEAMKAEYYVKQLSRDEKLNYFN